jgi:hypothetical protein
MSARAVKLAEGADVTAAINTGLDSYERSTGVKINSGTRTELVAHVRAAVRSAILRQFKPAEGPARHYWAERE